MIPVDLAGPRPAADRNIAASRRSLGSLRLAFIRCSCGLAGWLQRAARLLTYAAAGVMRRDELGRAIRSEWDEFARNPWVSQPALNEWEREFFFRFLGMSERVLLVGCGAGRDLIPLIEAGHAVTGLDLSADAIAICRRNLERRGLSAPLYVGSIEDTFPEGDFDAVVFTWFCYSYIPERRARVAVLGALPRLLRNGGRVLLTYAQRQPGTSRIPNRIASLFARLSGSDWHPEHGDYVEAWRGFGEPSVHFEHRFLPDEIAAEAQAAGLRVLHHETADEDGRLVLGR
jgi:SAM-dependent methyltransferase